MNVTKEMIEAGWNALVPTSRHLYVDKAEVETILTAALSVRAKYTREQINEMIGRGEMFVDNNSEAEWIAADELACPHCGGSGHKDDVCALSAQPATEPVAYASEYGLTTLASRAHHYCLSLTKRPENEFVIPIYTTPPADLREENERLKRAYQGALDNYQEAVEECGKLMAELEQIRAWVDPSVPEMTSYKDRATALKARVKSLEEENERLREALEWYANPEIYKPLPHGLAFERRDLSRHARATLEVCKANRDRAALKGGEA